MKSLEQKIKSANNAYRIGQPYLTDPEYDYLWHQLHSQDPHNPLLYHTSKDPTIPCDHVRHIHPIRGTQKAFTMEDLKPFLTRFKGEELVIQPKYDGVAAVIYKNPLDSGYPTSIVLFGDGIHGRDISYHAPRILHMTPSAAYERVELIIPNKLWDKSYGKNPRNTVSGWVNSNEIKQPDIITAFHHEGGFFDYVIQKDDYNDLDSLLLHQYAIWSFDVPIDGLMIKVRDPNLRLTSGDNGTYYHWSIAWKPPIQTKRTKVVGIHWNVSRNGRVIPKVEYEPITLCGTENRFATCNNAKWLIDKRLYNNSQITVGKAGEIIPKIIEVHEDPYDTYNHKIPKNCPICQAELSWVGVDLVCDSKSCIVQLSKSLAYFYSDKGMDVKGIGEAMITDLLYNPALRGILNNSPWALLEPDTYDIIQYIYDIWGDSRTDTYGDGIDAIYGKKDPARFIAALGYPGLAYKTALKVWQAVKGHSTKFNISSKAVMHFTKAMGDYTIAISMFQHFKFADLPLPAKVTYCVTGDLSCPRNDMIDYLTTKEWQFSNQVSKHTDVLILGDH